MKRILAILLAAMMLLSAASVALAEEPVTISYYAYWCGELDPGSYVETYVENALGIDVQIRKVAHQDKEAVNLMIANDLPDCGWFEQTPTYMFDQELVRNIPIDLVREYCPGLAAYMDEYPMLWAKFTDPEDETALVGLPDLYETNASLYLYDIFFRYDWIQKLGIDLGINVEQVTDKLFVGDKGITLDKLYEILDAFVNKDPDGNGVDDTVGLIKNWQDLLTAVSVIPSNMEVDGYAQEWYTNPAIKDLLVWLQKAYADGLIYKEIFTIAWGEDWELINQNASGISCSTSTNALNGWAANRPPRTLLDGKGKDAEVQLLMIPGICDADGHTYRTANVTPDGGETFFVNVDVDDEKLVEILKFYNWCNWNEDPEVIATLWKGEKDVNWVWDEETGFAVSTDTPVINGERGSQVFIRNTQLGAGWEWLTLEPDFAAGSKYWYKNNGGLWCDDLIYPYKNDINSETNATAISNEYSGDWTNIRNNYFMGVIMGEKDLDGDWDAYIEELNNVEYDEYLEELNKAPVVADLIAEYSK